MIATGYFKKICDNWEMRKKQLHKIKTQITENKLPVTTVT